MQAKTQTAPTARTGAKVTTEEAAATLRVASQTPRASLCRLGHWMGMRPVKLPNGRIWTPSRMQALCSLTLRYDCSRISGL